MRCTRSIRPCDVVAARRGTGGALRRARLPLLGSICVLHSRMVPVGVGSRGGRLGTPYGSLANIRATGAVTSVPFFLTMLASALGNAGRPTEGLKQLNEAVRQIETTKERWSESDVHRVRGELLIAVGDAVVAEKSLYQAIGVARRQSAKLFELRAAASLARLWRDQDKRTEARDLLAPIYNWFTEGFDTPVLKDAKALLDELM